MRREIKNFGLGASPARELCMVTALLLVLAAAPRQTQTIEARLDVGGMVGAAWYLPQTKQQMMFALENARGSFFGNEPLALEAMVNSMPVVGPWVMATEANGFDRAMLVTTGAIQLLGTAVALKRLILDEHTGEFGAKPLGPQITISPIVAGQIGLGLRITNF
jgi:hypothetical protein